MDTWDLAQLLRHAERSGRHPRNPDACERYGRMCEFFDACTGAASLDDPARYRVIDTQHPELAGPASAARPQEEVSSAARDTESCPPDAIPRTA